jgi:hypothetical protein
MIFCSKIVVFKNPASRTAASIFLSYPEMIASPTRININQSTFLKVPFGSLAHLRFLISFCPNTAIARSIAASPKVYEMSARNQNQKPAGSTIASMSA